jgi:hypothetical protein
MNDTQVRIAFYDDVGRILSMSQCPVTTSDEFIRLNEGAWGWAGMVVPEGTNPTTHYINEGVVSERPDPPTSLSELPIPCEVEVYSKTLGTSDSYAVDDGSFEYDDVPGNYTITVRAWPHSDAVFEIEV